MASEDQITLLDVTTTRPGEAPSTGTVTNPVEYNLDIESAYSALDAIVTALNDTIIPWWNAWTVDDGWEDKLEELWTLKGTLGAAESVNSMAPGFGIDSIMITPGLRVQSPSSSPPRVNLTGLDDRVISMPRLETDEVSYPSGVTLWSSAKTSGVVVSDGSIESAGGASDTLDVNGMTIRNGDIEQSSLDIWDGLSSGVKISGNEITNRDGVTSNLNVNGAVINNGAITATVVPHLREYPSTVDDDIVLNLDDYDLLRAQHGAPGDFTIRFSAGAAAGRVVLVRMSAGDGDRIYYREPTAPESRFYFTNGTSLFYFVRRPASEEYLYLFREGTGSVTNI